MCVYKGIKVKKKEIQVNPTLFFKLNCVTKSYFIFCQIERGEKH